MVQWVIRSIPRDRFFRALENIKLLFSEKLQNGLIRVVFSAQRCQLVRFMRKPYGFLRFARAYGHTMQSLRIFMIFADSH